LSLKATSSWMTCGPKWTMCCQSEQPQWKKKKTKIWLSCSALTKKFQEQSRSCKKKCNMSHSISIYNLMAITTPAILLPFGYTPLSKFFRGNMGHMEFSAIELQILAWQQKWRTVEYMIYIDIHILHGTRMRIKTQENDDSIQYQ
jgi:hypothetical protein